MKIPLRQCKSTFSANVDRAGDRPSTSRYRSAARLMAPRGAYYPDTMCPRRSRRSDHAVAQKSLLFRTGPYSWTSSPTYDFPRKGRYRRQVRTTAQPTSKTSLFRSVAVFETWANKLIAIRLRPSQAFPSACNGSGKRVSVQRPYSEIQDCRRASQLIPATARASKPRRTLLSLQDFNPPVSSRSLASALLPPVRDRVRS